MPQLKYPLDPISIGVLKAALDKTLVVLLSPLETAAANEGTHTLLNNTPCISLADGATNEAYFAFIPHQDILLSSMHFIWSTGATAKVLRWKVDIGEGGKGEVNNIRTTGGTEVSTTSHADANKLNFTPIHSAAGINLQKLKRGNLWGIKFSRMGAAAEDTLSAVALLYGIQIENRLYGF